MRRKVYLSVLAALGIVGVYGLIQGCSRGRPPRATVILECVKEVGLGDALWSALDALGGEGADLAASPPEARWLLGREISRGIAWQDDVGVTEKVLWLGVAKSGLLLDPTDSDWWLEPQIWCRQRPIRSAVVHLIAAHARHGLLGSDWLPVVDVALDSCDNSLAEQRALLDLCLFMRAGGRGPGLIAAAFSSKDSRLRRHAIVRCVQARRLPVGDLIAGKDDPCLAALNYGCGASAENGLRNLIEDGAPDRDAILQCVDSYRAMVVRSAEVSLPVALRTLGPVVSGMLSAEEDGPESDLRLMAIAMMVEVARQCAKETPWRDGGWGERVIAEGERFLGAADK